MASPVADIVDAEVGVTAEQSRVQALFSDALANDDKPVDDDEQTNLMQTSIPIDEELAHDKQDSTLADVPSGRHTLAVQLRRLGMLGGEGPPVCQERVSSLGPHHRR